MRNPFRKQDENVRPLSSGIDRRPNGTPTKPIDVKEKAPVEYQLSGELAVISRIWTLTAGMADNVHAEINDSGVFIQPSPPERPSFWTASSSRSTTSSKSRSLFDENEPFNISRESFDSYRRSFDISARSPVIQPDQKPRSSLDSRTFLGPPRHSNSFRRPLEVPGTQQEEEADNLEDVALDDPKPQTHKKKSMFSRLIDSDSHSERPVSQEGGKTSWHFGRKRGQSGQGAELGQIPKQEDEHTPKPDTQTIKKEERQTTPSAPENTQAPDITIDPAR